MSLAFSAIPGVGARAVWERIGTEAAHRRHVAFRDYRYNEVAFAAARANKVYIRYSPVGDAAGGGGAGTFVAPYLVRHTADLKALIAALPRTANTAIIFFDDDVIRGSPANTDQSCVIDWASVSIGRTFTGIRRPEITGFIPVVPGGPVTGSTVGSAAAVVGTVATIDVTGSPGIRIWWVRGRLLTSTTRDDFTIQPYKIAADVTDCTNTPYSFFSDATHFVINFGAHDLSCVEACCSTGGGIISRNVNDVAIDDTIWEGFGMDVLFTAGGHQTVRFEQEGTNVGVSRRTRNNWGDYHTSGHFGNGAGGFVTWHQCEFGGHVWDSLGAGDGNVCFDAAGGNEWGRYGCFQRLGGLSGTDAFFAAYDAAYVIAHGGHWTGFFNINSKSPNGLAPSTPRGHGNAATSPNYAAEGDCDWTPTSGHGLITNYIQGTVPAVADKDAQTSYVVYTWNRSTGETFSIAADTLCGVHDRMCIYSTSGVPTGFYYQPFGAGASAAVKGIFLNIELRFTGDGGSWAGKTEKWMDATANADFRFVHYRLRFMGNTPDNIYTAFGTVLNTCSLHNGVISQETAMVVNNLSITDPAGANYFTEASPGAVTAGGVLGLAQWRVQATQVDGITGLVNLAAAATWTDAAGVPLACRNASQLLPAAIDCWQDFLGVRRNPNQLLRSLGTIEANAWNSGNWRTRQFRQVGCWRPN